MPPIKALTTFLGICPFSFSSERVMKIFQRYNHSKTFPSVPPFEGGYDAQPKWWLQAVGIIENQIAFVQGDIGGSKK